MKIHDIILLCVLLLIKAKELCKYALIRCVNKAE